MDLLRFALFMPGQCRKTDRFPRASSKAVLTTLLVVNRWGERLDGANEAGVQQKAFGRQCQRFQQATMAVEQSVDIRKRCEDSDIEVTHVLSCSSFAEQYLPRLRHRDDAKRRLVVLRRCTMRVVSFYPCGNDALLGKCSSAFSMQSMSFTPPVPFAWQSHCAMSAPAVGYAIPYRGRHFPV